MSRAKMRLWGMRFKIQAIIQDLCKKGDWVRHNVLDGRMNECDKASNMVQLR